MDGDIYFVCWDRELIPPQQVEAMDYTAAETIKLNHDVTMEVLQRNSFTKAYLKHLYCLFHYINVMLRL